MSYIGLRLIQTHRQTYYHIPVDQDSRLAKDSTAFSFEQRIDHLSVQLCTLEGYIGYPTS